MDNLIRDSISEEIISVAESIAMEYGTKDLSVRRIINKMGVTNRVFYNRFHNIEEVLEEIYQRAASAMHASFASDKDISTDFFGYVTDVCVNVLLQTYDVKKRFSQYMFEFDSLSQANCTWWCGRIKELIEFAKETNLIKNVNSDLLSYTLWCFLRGFNADAVNRGLKKEDAVTNLKFGLNCLFEGVKINEA